MTRCSMRQWAAAALLAALAGCGSSPKENFYTLGEPQGPLPASNPSSSISVFVGPVTVPEAVDRTAMVLRTGPNSVDIDDTNRWAEPLKSAIPRVLAATLMRELGTPRVMASRAGTPSSVDFRVAVEIQRFDSSLDRGATLDALWTVTPAKGSGARTGRTLAEEPATSRDPAGVAAAHSRALERLGRDIAAAMR
ncbi:MAG TPA: PqiC family protein [Usitatibacter sp.]|nr:PqiC family protein [Usitatibacter sp.]